MEKLDIDLEFIDLYLNPKNDKKLETIVKVIKELHNKQCEIIDYIENNKYKKQTENPYEEYNPYKNYQPTASDKLKEAREYYNKIHEPGLVNGEYFKELKNKYEQAIKIDDDLIEWLNDMEKNDVNIKLGDYNKNNAKRLLKQLDLEE